MIISNFFVTDCIKEKLRIFLNDPQNDNFKKCFVPWLSNVTYGLIDDYDSLPPCEESEASTLSLNLANFFFTAAVYGFEECTGNNSENKGSEIQSIQIIKFSFVRFMK